jgi:hypothetical protein
VGNLCDTRGVEVTEGFPFFVISIDVGWLVLRPFIFSVDLYRFTVSFVSMEL